MLCRASCPRACCAGATRVRFGRGVWWWWGAMAALAHTSAAQMCWCTIPVPPAAAGAGCSTHVRVCVSSARMRAYVCAVGGVEFHLRGLSVKVSRAGEGAAASQPHTGQTNNCGPQTCTYTHLHTHLHTPTYLHTHTHTHTYTHTQVVLCEYKWTAWNA